MPEISSVGHHPVGPTDRPDRVHDPAERAQHDRPHQGPAEAGSDRDTVELSEQARLLSSLRDRAGIRTDLVDRVRQEIAQGTYETSEKLQSAIEALITRLEREP